MPQQAALHQTVALAAALFFVMVPWCAQAGPPYLSDDAEPTEYQHYEIYAFANGDVGDSGSGGEAGIDFNYGATPDLQLTAVLPIAYANPAGTPSAVNLGNVELAAKYRLLHQDDVGVDVAVFPRLFLPAGSAEVGERHAAFLLPIWFEKDWGKWSGFGGGGCVLNQGGNSRNFCLAGWAMTYRLLPKLQIGGELFHQTADTKGGRATTVLGAGATYDVSDNYHLLGYIGPTVQNAAETNRYTWYASILFTF
ncbi:MAG TPA: transporter [Rhizomicrobium sp.]|nr:transporter [Rhizomicrobium sp.]